MGNYRDLESEFVERTLKLIEQYYAQLEQYEFEEQFNYTLTINCLLGLIVMPKELAVTHIPNERLVGETREKIGLKESRLGDHIKTLRDLVKALRNSIAHFDIQVISQDDQNLINWVRFNDSEPPRGSRRLFGLSQAAIAA